MPLSRFRDIFGAKSAVCSDLPYGKRILAVDLRKKICRRRKTDGNMSQAESVYFVVPSS